mgnify:CR=1 FL=1
MYPIKINNKKKIFVRDFGFKLKTDFKGFFSSLRSPLHFIRFLRKSLYF